MIITGPHTDQSLDGSGLQAFIRGTFDPAKPVAINVIDFGADSDRATWESDCPDQRYGGAEPVHVGVTRACTTAITTLTS